MSWIIVIIFSRDAGWAEGKGRWMYFVFHVEFVSVCGQSLRQQWGLWVVCPSGWWVEQEVWGVVIHISVSPTWFWVAECPLVVGAGLVPFSGGDSPVCLSRGSWGRGATDTRVLAWFSSSTWKDSAYEKHTDNTGVRAHAGLRYTFNTNKFAFTVQIWHANEQESVWLKMDLFLWPWGLWVSAVCALRRVLVIALLLGG